MFRRLIAISLLPSLLLPPAATLAHTHPDVQPDDHTRPHLHLAPPTHAHHHGPNGHRHDDEAHDISIPASPQDQEARSDHDDDAVFLTLDASGFKSVRNEVADSFRILGLIQHSPLDPCFACSTFAQRPHPPPSPHSKCPRYLRHLALLI